MVGLGSRNKAGQRMYPCWRFFLAGRGVFHPLSFPELPENSGSTPIQSSSGTWLIGSFSKVAEVQAVKLHFQRAELLHWVGVGELPVIYGYHDTLKILSSLCQCWIRSRDISQLASYQRRGMHIFLIKVNSVFWVSQWNESFKRTHQPCDKWAGHRRKGGDWKAREFGEETAWRGRISSVSWSCYQTLLDLLLRIREVLIEIDQVVLTQTPHEVGTRGCLGM